MPDPDDIDDTYGAVAQWSNAPDCLSGFRGFKSRLSRRWRPRLQSLHLGRVQETPRDSKSQGRSSILRRPANVAVIPAASPDWLALTPMLG